MAPEWTDEKHGLFLKSMESTFVNQLYRSIEMFGLQSHKSSASRSKSLKQKQTSTRTSGQVLFQLCPLTADLCSFKAISKTLLLHKQFKVLRDGCWSKVDFQKEESEHDQREECTVPLSNPWIQRYRNSKMQANKRCLASCAKASLTMPTSSLPPSSEDFNDTNIGIAPPVLDTFLSRIDLAK